MNEEGLHRAARAVIDAWFVPGPRPDIHAQAKRDLYLKWPVLAQAIIQLAAYADDL